MTNLIFGDWARRHKYFKQPEGNIMRLKQIAEDVEQRRIEILKNNADRAKRQVKDALARYKIKKANDQLMKLRVKDPRVL